MAEDSIIRIRSLGFQWETVDPFIFCVHHKDDYPAGNSKLGPDASLDGRNLGQDFQLKDGWRMYHGMQVPGFPVHPHRGFETVTIVREGWVDHSDSLGGAGRYGEGDVQWMTAGRGIQHSEMFPLIRQDKPNPLELFQVWLNLPKRNKFVDPYYKMLWGKDIPVLKMKDDNGKTTLIELTAGKINDVEALPPTPDSWAADPDNHVTILTARIEAGGTWALPASDPSVNRMLYFYKGERLLVDGNPVSAYKSIQVKPDRGIILEAGNTDCRLLMLQARPINEPVMQYGPFVMNTQEEIQQAFRDYRETEFGGWPWPVRENTHGLEQGRFAKHN